MLFGRKRDANAGQVPGVMGQVLGEDAPRVDPLAQLAAKDKKAKRRRIEDLPMQLLVDTRDTKTLYELFPNGEVARAVQEADAAHPECLRVSFSSTDDLEGTYDRKVSLKKQMGPLLELATEELVVAPTDTSGFIYATPLNRVVMESAVRFVSARQVIRKLWQSYLSSEGKEPPEAPYVVTIEFPLRSASTQELDLGDAPGVTGFVVLMVSVDDIGRFKSTYATTPSGDKGVRDAIDAFIRTERLGKDGKLPKERLTRFSGEEFMAALAGAQPYPSEAQILGMPRSKVLRGVSALSVLALLATGAATGGAWWLAKEYTAQARNLNQRAEANTIAARDLAVSRLSALTQIGSVDPARLTELARAVYREGTRVEVVATRESIQLRVLSKTDNVDLQPQEIAALLAQRAPQGCSIRPIETNRQLTEIYVSYDCDSVDRKLASLLGSSR